MALGDEKYRVRAKELAAEMKVIELAANSRFQNSFVRNLSFPAKPSEGRG